MADGSGAIQGVGTAIVSAVAHSSGTGNQGYTQLSPPISHAHVRAPKGRTISPNKG